MVFEGNRTNGYYPEATPEQKESLAEKNSAIMDVIGNQFDTDYDEAKTKKKEDENLSQFHGTDIEGAINTAGSNAMANRAKEIADLLCKDAISNINLTEEQKELVLQMVAVNMVSKHISSKPSDNQTQFNQ